MNKILVCLSTECWQELKHLDSVGTMIITDLDIYQPLGHIIRPNQDVNDSQRLVRNTLSFLEELSAEVDFENIVAFSNTFYECTLCTLCSYIETLDDLLRSILTAERIEVWFLRRIPPSFRGSAYFMAEHESQGQRLYDRYQIIAPYLIDVCKKYNFIPSFALKSTSITQYIFSVIRVAGVFAAKLYVSMRNHIASQPHESFAPNEAADIFILSRSKMQTESIARYSLDSEFRFHFFLGQTFLDRGYNRKYFEDILCENKKNAATYITDPDFSLLVRDYIKAIYLLFLNRRWHFEYRGVRINLTFAVKELIVMVPELNSYHRSLINGLKHIKKPKLDLALSSEQKSPHAYIDAKVLKAHNIKCAHVMLVDQHIRPLPAPFFGEYFFTDTFRSASLMQLAYSAFSSRIFYVGSFKALGWPEFGGFKRNFVQIRRRICFFTQSAASNQDDYRCNFLVIKTLFQIFSTDVFDLVVKLHPRDRLANYTENALGFNLTPFVYFGNDKGDFFSTNSLNITFPSGVVFECIFSNKPLIILGFGPGKNFKSYQYWDDDYIGCISEMSSLQSVVAKNLYPDFVQYRRRLFIRLGIITDVTDIDNNIIAALSDSALVGPPDVSIV
jgi:hypothetical protein